MDTLNIIVYDDASFATNDDNSSKLGNINMLFDETIMCHVPENSSKKYKMVVRSITARAVCDFIDAFDAAFISAKDVTTLMVTNIPIDMFKNSKQLFKAINKGTRKTDKRLMIDISSARQSYKRLEIRRIGLVKGVENPSDGLRNLSCNKTLPAIFFVDNDNNPVEQRIVCVNVTSISETIGGRM